MKQFVRDVGETPLRPARIIDSRRPGARCGRADRVRKGPPIVVDRGLYLYRELVKGAIKPTHDDFEAKVAAAASEKKTAPVNDIDVARFSSPRCSAPATTSPRTPG